MGAKGSYRLFGSVMELSQANNWEDAVEEWEIVGYEEDDSCSSSCVCGKENLKYLFTIKNSVNGNSLFPIGSECIKKFQQDSLAEELKGWTDYIKLKNKIAETGRIELSAEYFSRCLLRFLLNQGAFSSNRYNGNNPRNDYKFMLDMFNKRDKGQFTPKQSAKVGILLRSIAMFVQLFDPAPSKTNTTG